MVFLRPGGLTILQHDGDDEINHIGQTVNSTCSHKNNPPKWNTPGQYAPLVKKFLSSSSHYVAQGVSYNNFSRKYVALHWSKTQAEIINSQSLIRIVSTAS